MFERKLKSEKKTKKALAKKKVFKKKVCKFTPEEIEGIDYKDVNRLRYFLTERGKVIPSRISGASAKSQRHLMRQIKIAREIALLPYVSD